MEPYHKTFGNNFRFVLYCSFASSHEFIGQSLVYDLYFLCKQYNSDLFDLVKEFEFILKIVRYSDGQEEENIPAFKGYFDNDFINQYLKAEKGIIETIYLCGAEKMCNEIRIALL